MKFNFINVKAGTPGTKKGHKICLFYCTEGCCPDILSLFEIEIWKHVKTRVIQWNNYVIIRKVVEFVRG